MAKYRGKVGRLGKSDVAFEYAWALHLGMLHWSDAPRRLVANGRLG
jgi:hypothetical protein